jgi:hypothetical protein
MEDKKTIWIVLGLGVVGLYLFMKNKKKAPVAAAPDKQEEPDKSQEPSIINWRETQSAGASYMETNLQILVNGEEKVMEFFNNSGSLTVADGDLINILVIGKPYQADQIWLVSGTNNLIVTENGKELVNKSVKTQDNFDYSFMVKGGRTYQILNYTIPNN